MSTSQKVQHMPTWKLLIFTTGNFGWSILGTMVGLLTYFYIPPETGVETIPLLVNREAIFGITIVGICGLLAEWIGMIIDPTMAAISDRTKSKIGRRKIYMLISSAPFAILAYLLFHPPVAEVSPINAIWIIGVIIVFNVFRSMYQIPYGALVPELGATAKIRMFISTFHSIAWALGFVLGGTLIYTFKDILQTSFGMSPLIAFRTIAAIFAVLGFIFTLLPTLVIDEKTYCSGHISNEPPIKALVEAFKNRDFFIITIAQTFYFMADKIFQFGLVYYVTILLGLKEAMVGTLGAAMFLMSFLWYYPVNKIVEKVSKKSLVSIGFVIQVLVLVMFAVSDIVPVTPIIWSWTIIGLLSVMAAITGIVPGAVTAEVVRADGIRTGVHKEATYGAAMAIFMKIPRSLTALAFPAMILLGRSSDNPFGVRLTLIISTILMIIAILLWNLYNERDTLKLLSTEG